MYQFDDTNEINVQVADIHGHYYPAILEISENRVSLDIYAETNEHRQFQLDYSSLDSLKCEGFIKKYYLYDVIEESRFNSTLMGSGSNRGFCRVKLSAKKVIVWNANTLRDNEIKSIEFRSDAIVDWIGQTTTQTEIPTLLNEELTKGNNPAFKEFEVELPSIGKLYLKYNWARGGIDRFVVGTSFPPSLVLELNRTSSFDEALELVNELKQLMFFIIGSEFQIDTKVKLCEFEEGYIIDTSSNPTYSNWKGILYPLLHHSIDTSYTKLEPFDLSAFSKYFLLSQDIKGHWSKYQYYKKLENEEERHLGYFRILEALLHKQENFFPPELFDSCIGKFKGDLAKHFKVKTKKMGDFLNYIKNHVNTKKYNVRRNLIKQFKSLPEEFKKNIKFSQEDLNKIVETRDKITHAAQYSINERDRTEYLIFLECLLLFEMFNRIGINYQSSMYAIMRLPSFAHISTHSVEI